MWGKAGDPFPNVTQCLLWKRPDGKVGLCLPMVDRDRRAVLQSEGRSLKLRWDTPGSAGRGDEATLALLGHGPDPFALMETALAALAERQRTFRLRRDKTQPRFLDYLGWCTWDAFYHSVDAEKVEAGLRSFKEGGVGPGFLILDDGWLDTTGDYLNSLEASPKFPHGLDPLVRAAKERYGVRFFGVWHAFEGYWVGLNPEGPLAREWPTVANQGRIRPWEGANDKLLDLRLISPEAIHRFYHEFHRRLRQAGVDLVKVDGQSALEVFTAGRLDRVPVMRAYQEALQGAVALNFGNELIHCMCHGSDVVYHMGHSQVWRNSQDYLPRTPNPVQQRHLVLNAFNALWSSGITIPDWDMFQTHGPMPEFHAAARALSGGPVYVSDRPGEQRFEILRRLALADGRVLRADHPALPLARTLFEDPTKADRPLLIQSRSGASGLVGAFNVRPEAVEVKDRVSPREIPGLEGESFAVWSWVGQSLKVCRSRQSVALKLPPEGFEILTFVPLDGGVAALGSLDHYVGVAALCRSGWVAESAYQIVSRGGGCFGFRVDEVPQGIDCEVPILSISFDQKSGLLKVTTEASAGPVTLSLLF